MISNKFTEKKIIFRIEITFLFVKIFLINTLFDLFIILCDRSVSVGSRH